MAPPCHDRKSEESGLLIDQRGVGRTGSGHRQTVRFAPERRRPSAPGLSLSTACTGLSGPVPVKRGKLITAYAAGLDDADRLPFPASFMNRGKFPHQNDRTIIFRTQQSTTSGKWVIYPINFQQTSIFIMKQFQYYGE
jgi:hypothetical protein